MTRMQIGCLRAIAATCLALASVRPAVAQELWVAPTAQQDTGGLGVGSNVVWPVTPAGVVRLAFGVPNDLQTFQNAKVVVIPTQPGGDQCSSCTSARRSRATSSARCARDLSSTTSPAWRIGCRKWTSARRSRAASDSRTELHQRVCLHDTEHCH